MHSTTRRTNLKNDIAVFKAQIEKQATTEYELATNVSGVYRAFRDLDLSRYDLGKHRAAAPDLMSEIFGLQLALRDKIPSWHAAGLMSADVQKAARDVLRVSRYAIDILGELWISHERLDPDRETLRAFTGTAHNTLISPKHATGGTVPFQTGDVIITRGRLYNSAAIARVGDIDSQFSHAAVVYIDEHGGHWVVQSLIEEGAQIVPLTELLSDDLARAVVFRHRDKNLAQRAAYAIHDRVKLSRSRAGKRILYDFTMELDNEHNLYCSKLVRRAYKEASVGRVMLPTFPTSLAIKNRDFLDRLGVTAFRTFSPGDMELEPDFDVVAEWQDYRATAETRIQDITMDKLFEWMEHDNFRFRETFVIRLISMLGRGATYLSETAQDLVFQLFPKVPPNMSRRAVAAIAMLNDTGRELQAILRASDEAHVRNAGLPMHPTMIMKQLDEIHAASPDEIGYLKRAPRP